MSGDTHVQRDVYRELQQNTSAGDSATTGGEPGHKIKLGLQLARRRRHIGSSPAPYMDEDPEEASPLL